MRPGIERLSTPRGFMRRETQVQRGPCSHHQRVNDTTDRIRVRVAGVEQSQHETANGTRRNQADHNVAYPSR